MPTISEEFDAWKAGQAAPKPASLSDEYDQWKTGQGTAHPDPNIGIQAAQRYQASLEPSPQ